MLKALSDNIELLIVLFTAVSAIVFAIIKFFDFKTKSQTLASIRSSFDSIVEKLSSDNEIEKISAAILLRRFFDKKTEEGGRKTPFVKETINVIASLLRNLPTCIFQKTLADGLSYTLDLKNVDLQKANFQQAYLGRKDGKAIDFSSADFFRADFSQALIDNVIAVNTIFYQARFHQATIKNANCEGANFCGADLLGARFVNVNLLKAEFKNAVNIPEIIADHLDQDFIYRETVIKNIERRSNAKKRNVFISRPAIMTIDQHRYTELFTEYLIKLGIEAKTFNRSEYGHYGQIGKIRTEISQCSGIVIFGFKQLKINSGEYRPFTDEYTDVKDKWLPTPWNNIEVGMALMKGLPALIIKDPEVNDGIFDNTISESFIHTVVITTGLDSKVFEENINAWINNFMN
jgi:hypothetical protein